MEKISAWLQRWYYRNVHPIRVRNTLDRSEWDGTVPAPQCCRVMAAAVAEGDSPVSYQPVFRRWRLLNLYHRMLTDWQIEYCPWCGQQLPSDLGAEWDKRIQKLGFIDIGHYSETPGLPEDYRTDKWWKDAGL